jgi:hypothetical protein
MSAAKSTSAIGGFRCAHPPYVRRVSVVLASFPGEVRPRIDVDNDNDNDNERER